MEHVPVTSSFWWGKFIARADLPKTTKQIAMALPFWGDEDGANIRPGNRILAIAVGIEERSVREHLKLLRDLGLIERVGFGRSGGKADVYRLTTPGAGYPAIPMLADPHWQPVATKSRRALTEIRAAAQARRAAAAPTPPDATGTPVPQDPATDTDRPDGYRHPRAASGSVDNLGYRHVGAASEAVDNPDYRHPGAANRAAEADSYRHRGAELPAPGCQRSGTGVPPTTHTNPDQPTTGSPQASTSLATVDLGHTPALADFVDDPDDRPWTPDVQPAEPPAPRIVQGAAELIPDPVAAAAIRAILAELPNDGEWFRVMARRRLRAAGWTDPPAEVIDREAAHLATRAEPARSA